MHNDCWQSMLSQTTGQYNWSSFNTLAQWFLAQERLLKDSMIRGRQ